MSRIVVFFAYEVVGCCVVGNLLIRANGWRCVRVAGRLFRSGVLVFLISMFLYWFREVRLCYVMNVCGCIVAINVLCFDCSMHAFIVFLYMSLVWFIFIFKWICKSLRHTTVWFGFWWYMQDQVGGQFFFSAICLIALMFGDVIVFWMFFVFKWCRFCLHIKFVFSG